MRKILTIIVIVATSLMLTMCSSKPVQKSATVIKVVGGHVRPMVRGRTTATYMTLKNLSNQPRYLVEASSKVARVVQLHKTEKVNGVYKMVPQKFIIIPAHSIFQFYPGKYHINLA